MISAVKKSTEIQSAFDLAKCSESSVNAERTEMNS